MLGVLVGTVLERRALHVVAVVEQNQAVAEFGLHLLEEVGVVGKLVVTAVGVSGLDDGKGGFFGRTRSQSLPTTWTSGCYLSLKHWKNNLTYHQLNFTIMEIAMQIDQISIARAANQD